MSVRHVKLPRRTRTRFGQSTHRITCSNPARLFNPMTPSAHRSPRSRCVPTLEVSCGGGQGRRRIIDTNDHNHGTFADLRWERPSTSMSRNGGGGLNIFVDSAGAAGCHVGETNPNCGPRHFEHRSPYAWIAVTGLLVFHPKLSNTDCHLVNHKIRIMEQL